MKSQGSEPDVPPDRKAVEDQLLARVKEVARRIVERVRKVAGDTAPGPALKPDEPTGEAPAVG